MQTTVLPMCVCVSQMLSGARVQLSGLKPPRGEAGFAPAQPLLAGPNDPGAQTQGLRGILGVPRCPAVGDRVFVKPTVEQQQQQQQQQQEGVRQLWQAATVASVCATSLQAVVQYLQVRWRQRAAWGIPCEPPT